MSTSPFVVSAPPSFVMSPYGKKTRVSNVISNDIYNCKDTYYGRDYSRFDHPNSVHSVHLIYFDHDIPIVGVKRQRWETF